MKLSIRRTESQVQLSDSGLRYRRSWRPPEIHQAMILVHGYAEHSGRYDEMAMFFARRAFAVHAYDQAGHGRTKGARGHVDRFERLLDELNRFIEIVRLEEPGVPIVLVGHSMGGLVSAATLAFRQPDVDFAVLSGALLQLGSDTPVWKQWAAKLLSPFGGAIGLSAGLDLEALSRDPEVGRRYQDDPFVKDRMSARFAAGMMTMVKRMPTAAPQLNPPLMVLHGAADAISPPEGSQVLHAGLRPEVAEMSALRIYPELRHEIFNEPERAQIWQDMLNWLAGEPVETLASAPAAESGTDG